MPVIKAKDLAFGRLRSPDLDAQEEFLTHFGMIRAARTPNALYMRGTDPSHQVHERWADTDRLNARTPGNLLSAEEALISQCGQRPPDKFIRHVIQ